MNYRKISAVIATVGILAGSLAPLSASALSTATMSLTGSSNKTGSFAVTVYENTGADTVTGGSVVLDFSGPVTGVSYDYSVGPFTCLTPSGAHNVCGTVTGTQPIAKVLFTITKPATVTASVDAASYLKNVTGTTVSSFVISRGSASFTYSAPATTGSTSSKPKSGSSKPTSKPPVVSTGSSSNQSGSNSTGSTTSTSSNSSKKSKTNSSHGTKSTASAIKGSSTTHKATVNVPMPKTTKTRHTGLVTSTVLVLAILVAAAYWFFFQKRTVTAPAKVYKLDTDAKSKSKAKSAVKSTRTNAKTTQAKSKSGAAKK